MAQGVWAVFSNLGKSKASLWTSDQPRVTFKDVAGCEEAKRRIEGSDRLFKESQKDSKKLGAKVPKGALLVAVQVQVKLFWLAPLQGKHLYHFIV